MHIRVSGAWQKLKAAWIKINGTWTSCKSIWINVNGTWIEMAFSSGRLYTVSSTTRDGYEVNPDTLALTSLNGTIGHSNQPNGIGGILGRLYHSHWERFSEINVDTLATINESPNKNTDLFGAGGTRTQLFTFGSSTNRLYKVNPDTLAFVSSYAPTGGIYGCGGIDDGSVDRLYLSNASDDTYEISTTTYAVINQNFNQPGSGPGYGIGGNNERLFYSQRIWGTANSQFELNPDTMAVINSYYPGTTGMGGIGGLKV